MRIVTYTACLAGVVLLSGCATPPSAPRPVAVADPLKIARAYCRAQGFTPGTYDFESCYNCQPAVEAHDRNDRLANLDIIRVYKSASSGMTLSRPVY